MIKKNIIWTPELQEIKIKNYTPKTIIAWIDKNGEARSINEPKWKWRKIKIG